MVEVSTECLGSPEEAVPTVRVEGGLLHTPEHPGAEGRGGGALEAEGTASAKAKRHLPAVSLWLVKYKMGGEEQQRVPRVPFGGKFVA